MEETGWIVHRSFLYFRDWIAITIVSDFQIAEQSNPDHLSAGAIM